MRRLAIIFIIIAVAGAACRSRRQTVQTETVSRADTVRIISRDSAEIIRTVYVERPHVIIEHTDSPRRRIIFYAEHIKDSATATDVTAVEVDSAKKETVSVKEHVRTDTGSGTSRWLWLAAGAVIGFIVRSFAEIRSHR